MLIGQRCISPPKVISHYEKAIIKIYSKNGDTVILHSLNSNKHQPFVANKGFQIEGILRNIIKYS